MEALNLNQICGDDAHRADSGGEVVVKLKNRPFYELNSIRQRQENYLRRELDRIDDYFTGYEQELSQRAARAHSENTKLKASDRLAAAKAEHTRRRTDQVQRHEIRVLPRLDALLLLAEPAWRTTVTLARHGQTPTHAAHFVPRCRRWFLDV